MIPLQLFFGLIMWQLDGTELLNYADPFSPRSRRVNLYERDNMGSSDILIGKWKEADSTLLAKYLSAARRTFKTIVDENGRVFDLVPRMPKYELKASTSTGPPEFNYSSLSGIFDDKEMRILMVGLKGAGKTTILNKLYLTLREGGDQGDTGFVKINLDANYGVYLENLVYQKMSFIAGDLGVRNEYRSQWRPHFHNVEGIIFVVDSSDRQRIHEAGKELHMIINEDELRKSAILVLRNKVDVEGSMKKDEIVEKLGLFCRNWRVEDCCTNDALGLLTGLDWLLTKHANKAVTEVVP